MITLDDEGVKDEWKVIHRKVSNPNDGSGESLTISDYLLGGDFRHFKIEGWTALTGTTPTFTPVMCLYINELTASGSYIYNYTTHVGGVVTEIKTPVSTSFRMGELPANKSGYFHLVFEIFQPRVPHYESEESSTALGYPLIKGRCDVVDITSSPPDENYMEFSGIVNTTNALTTIDFYVIPLGGTNNYSSTTRNYAYKMMIPINSL